MSQILKPKKGYKQVKGLFGKYEEIPEEWEYAKIEDFCKKITSGGTPDRNNSEYYEGEIPWIKSGELKDNFISNSEEKITQIGLDDSSAKLFPKNTVLIAMYGATIGKTAIIKKKSTTNQAICAILPDNSFDSFYLQQLLISKRKILISFGMGAGQPNINQEIIRTFHIPFPSLFEQQKISTILSNVNNLITNTQKIINQTKSLKQGLMQKLLTKGINHTKFKKVKWNYGKLLEIPETWNIVLLDTIAKRGSGHTPDIKNPEFYNGGIKWVSLADSNRLDNVYITETTKEISQKGIENSSAVKHPSGVVILSRDAGVGKSAITKTEMAVSQHFMVWQCGEHLNNYFLYYLLQFWKPFFESIAIGTTIPTIGLPFFKKFKIIFPQKTEQDKIATILSNIDSKIKSQIQYKEKLEKLKKSLLQKLLTGKVRVKT